MVREPDALLCQGIGQNDIPVEFSDPQAQTNPGLEVGSLPIISPHVKNCGNHIAEPAFTARTQVLIHLFGNFLLMHLEAGQVKYEVVTKPGIIKKGRPGTVDEKV